MITIFNKQKIIFNSHTFFAGGIIPAPRNFFDGFGVQQKINEDQKERNDWMVLNGLQQVSLASLY